MTLFDIIARVKAIKRLQSDDEAAHAEEDKLHQEVLAFIASGGCDNPWAYAAEALKTTKIKFARWCA